MKIRENWTSQVWFFSRRMREEIHSKLLSLGIWKRPRYLKKVWPKSIHQLPRK